MEAFDPLHPSLPPPTSVELPLPTPTLPHLDPEFILEWIQTVPTRRGLDPANPQAGSAFFNRISVEIRRVIYRQVFTGSRWVPYESDPKEKHTLHFRPLFSCRRMFDEAVAMYYEMTAIQMGESSNYRFRAFANMSVYNTIGQKKMGSLSRSIFKSLPFEALCNTKYIRTLFAVPGRASGPIALPYLRHFENLKICVLMTISRKLPVAQFPGGRIPKNDKEWVMVFITEFRGEPQDLLWKDLGFERIEDLENFQTAVVAKYIFDPEDSVQGRPVRREDGFKRKVGVLS